MFWNYFAVGLLAFFLLFVIYGVFAIRDIPYKIAKEKEHPHQDAIYVASWISVFTLHMLWPFLWMWASLGARRSWIFTQLEQGHTKVYDRASDLSQQVVLLEEQVVELKRAVNNL